MKKLFASIAMIILILAGCNSSDSSDNNANEDSNGSSTPIGDTYWELTKLEGTMVDQSATTGEKVHFILNTTDETVSGYSGCNLFTGNFTLEEGNRIKFSKIASTRMACPDATINESEVLNVFNLADNYTMDGDQLTLNVGKRAPLAVFKKVTPENRVIEKHWKLKTLEGQEVEMADNQEKEIYFMLHKDENRVTGFAGCNTLSGTYSIEEGQRIRFSQMAVTLRSCPDVDVNESAFLEVFELADNYTLQGDKLMLNVGRRAPLAVFEAVYF